MPPQPFKKIYDWLGSGGGGMNSGIDPLLLPKNQFAFANNGTFRGEFLDQRPPTQKLALSYATSIVQTAFQSGLFQAAGYYKPDSGAESVCVAIAGRIYLITPGTNSATISEITISGNPNPSNIAQGWFCQAEQFLIFNDGLTLPFFYDGANSRRSLGASQLLGIVDTGGGGGAGGVPAVGETVVLTLKNNYTGPANLTIYIDDATYAVTQIGGNAQAYGLVLQNISDIPGNTVTGLTELVAQSALLGAATNLVVTTSPGGSSQTQAFFTLQPHSYKSLPSGVNFGIPNSGWSVASYDSNTGQTELKNGSLGPYISSTLYSGAMQPNVTVGILKTNFTVPAVLGTVNVVLSTAYTGAVGQLVMIGGAVYQIVGLNNSTPLPSKVITVENLTDTAGHTIPDGTAPAGISAAELYSLPELPAGRMLVYGLGQVWEAGIDGITFLPSDTADATSGSPAYNYRDAVLKVTQNQTLGNEGVFRVPGTVGTIQALQFVAILDTSLGQGPLEVFTATSIFSCAAPFNPTTYPTLTTPILTQALIGAGGISQDAVTPANGDLIFQSADGGVRSLLLARLDFNQWGNTPITREMERALSTENLSLLPFDSSVQFDNRYLKLAGLTQAARGVYATSIIALNFDPISSLRGKAPSIWDGQWQGLNALKLISGYFNGIQRCFAVCLSQDLTQIEIHEVLPSATTQTLDDGVKPVTSYFESSVLFNYSQGQHNPRPANPNHEYLRMACGEIFVDSINADVQFQAFYKPDQWPNWVPWHSWTEKYNPANDPGFRPRIPLPDPNNTGFDKANDRPLWEGFCFQFKLVAIGKCRFLGARFEADIIPQPEYGQPPSST